MKVRINDSGFDGCEDLCEISHTTLELLAGKIVEVEPIEGKELEWFGMRYSIEHYPPTDFVLIDLDKYGWDYSAKFYLYKKYWTPILIPALDKILGE